MNEEYINIIYGYPYCRQHIKDYYKRQGVRPTRLRFYDIYSLRGRTNITYEVFGELDEVLTYELNISTKLRNCAIIKKTID